MVIMLFLFQLLNTTKRFEKVNFGTKTQCHAPSGWQSTKNEGHVLALRFEKKYMLEEFLPM